MRTLLVAALVMAPVAFGKPKRPPKPETPPPPAAEPAAAPAPAPAPSPKREAAAPPSNEESGALLERAKSLYGQLEYDKVIPLTEVLLARDDLPLEMKLEAHRLNGSAKAIVQDPVDAEKPFRLLLRLRPEYDLPKDTPPKILAAFRKVQTEERALAQQAENFNREKKISELKFLDEPPRQAKGGKPFAFSLRLRDPGAAVDSVTVPYRKSGQAAYSSLALTRDEEGKWVGQIPAEYTADEKGFTLEYYVESSDAKGPLLSEGNAAMPIKADVSAGTVVSGRPPPVHRGVFWAAFGLTLGAGAASGASAISFFALQNKYKALGPGEVPGATAVGLQNQGNAAAMSTNVALVITGVLAVVTAVLIPFTNFDASAQ